jgi:protein arginine kinase activator
VICQACEKKPATVHFTEIKDGEKTALHLCDDCASQKGLTHGTLIPPLLASLVEGMHAATKGPELKCPKCAMTFDEFRSKGRLGCPHDYEAFEAELAPLVEKIHGAKRHAGRVPRSEPPASGGDDRLASLRRELAQAVRDEKYEDAAKLRDEIRRAEETSRGAV